MTFRYIAWQNVRRQWRDYAAYLFATGFSVMVFFVFVSLYFHPQFNELAASNIRMKGLFVVSAILVGMFSMLFLWYSSSLFFHKRNREVGTWVLLGMKKREAAWILYLESFIVGILALGAGIVLGMLLRRLFLLLLVRMMSLPMTLEVQIDARPIAVTAGAFVALFAATGLSGVLGVLRYDLIRLFRDEQTGEDKPRFAVVQAVLAAVTIATGYYLAARPQQGTVGIDTLGLILVVTIVGTFLLFGGVCYLAVRAQKRRLASKAEPLGTVSAGQVLFRIRRNAKFLALVAVLNAVAVTSVGTFLTFREERDLLFESLSNTAPFDFSFLADSPELVEDVEELARRADPEQEPDSAFVRAIIPTESLRYSDVGSVDALISRSSYAELASLSELPELRVGEIGEREMILVARTGAEPEHVVGQRVSGLP
ncbi:MAG: FtsX-like permease family protein, partial [Spirochaetota bacterium]